MSDTSSAFGQYHLSEKIAQGGMAEIFKGKAIDAEGIEKTVVIKRILPQIAANPEFVSMLIDEAKIAVQLSHGNIAQIYDLGKVGEDYFIVMEYVLGKSLSQIARRLRTLGEHCPIPVACTIACEIAAGLDYMHRKTDDHGNPLGIIHRDISPQNIIITESSTIKIIDFGIAKAKTKIVTTDSGIVKGKFAYMSPEHAEGETLDHRSDIFSLGIILYELLTGQRLFKGKNNAETVRRVKKTKVPRPSSLRAGISPDLDRIILKALAKNRNKRYQQADELKTDLTRLLINEFPEFKQESVSDLVKHVFAEEIPTQLLVMDTREPKTVLDKPRKKTKAHEEKTGVASKSLMARQLSEYAEDWESSLDSLGSEDSPAAAVKKKSLWERTRPALLKITQIGTFLILAGLLILGLRVGAKHLTVPLDWLRQWRTQAPLPVEKTLPETVATMATPTVVPKESPIPLEPARLLIKTEPAGAQIYVNEVLRPERSPFDLKSLPPGTYKIGLHKEGFQFWVNTVVLHEGEAQELNVSLQMDFGGLRVSSLPEGATVWLNGIEAGKTPLVKDRLPPNTIFKVLLKLPGYEETRDEVKIFAGRTQVVNLPLKKLSRQPPK